LNHRLCLSFTQFFCISKLEPLYHLSSGTMAAFFTSLASFARLCGKPLLVLMVP
jgi:hypothetical protein